MVEFEVRDDGEGGVATVVLMEAAEADLLVWLPGELRGVVAGGEGSNAGGSAGAVAERLFPRAYLDPTEEEAETEWQRLMHEDLLRSKLDAFDTLRRSLGDRAEAPDGRVRVELDDAGTAAWLGALNDARLALGVLLEVTEDLDISTVPPDDPRASGLQLYGWLTHVQGEFVTALQEV